MPRERSSKLRAGRHDGSDRPRGAAKSVATETEYANPAAADASGADNRPVDDERRRAEIALAAYYRAERRGFGGHGEMDDWLQAEREIDSGAALHSAMSPRDAAARDRDLIENDRLATWAKKLKVSTPRLREAIERVGPSVSVVKQYLESTPPPAS